MYWWFWCILPTFTFWIVAGGLHLFGFNQYYNGKVTIKEMIWRECMVDTLQLTGGFFRYITQSNESKERDVFISNILWGLIWIEWVEYLTHRFIHTFSYFNQWHKVHHRMIPVHTLGTFFNDIRELALTSPLISISVFIFDLNWIEVSISSTISILFTIYDHTPSQPGEYLKRHEYHHMLGPQSEFAQPFSGWLDILFGTTYERIYGKYKQEVKQIKN